MASQSISKIVFKKIAEVQDKNELEIYRDFLNHITDFRLNVGNLTQYMIKDLYGKEDKNPKYFDYRNHCNWAALANGVMKNNESLCFYQQKKGYMAKIFDSSIFKKMFESNEDKSRDFTKHIFLVSKEKKDLKISYTTNSSNSDIFPFMSERNFVGEKHTVKNINLGTVLNELISQKCDSSIRLPNECNFDELTNSSTAFSHVKAPVIIASHTGCKIDWKHSNMNNEKVQNYFSILASYNEVNQNDPIIVCLSLDSDNNTIIGYTPSYVMRTQILKQINIPLGRNSDIRDFLKDSANKAQGKKSQKAQLKHDQKIEKIDKWLSEHALKCECDCCKITKTYSKNVAYDGPQKLFKIDLDVKEYLKFFNLYNDSNIERLRQALNLTIASLDIESYTREISRKSRVKNKIANISSIGQATEVEGVQDIALIGFGDHFDNENMKHYEKFRITEVEETKHIVTKMMDHIIERHTLVQKEKAQLLYPLFAFIDKYKETHISFWEEELKDKYEKDKLSELIKESFENSLIGKFEKHLQKLQSCFAIFTFNGGKYDLILLHSHIVCYFKEKNYKKPLHLTKKDSRIQKMRLRSGIIFLDICDLIGPGNSLAKFSKLTGQEEVKMVFPFQKFTSIGYLDETSLPKSQKEWFNDLKNDYTDEEEIRRAHQDFTRLGVKTIGEYLEAYLKSMLNHLFYSVTNYYLKFFFQLMFVFWELVY